MPLGKNLKKKQLIPESGGEQPAKNKVEKEKSPRKKTVKKGTSTTSKGVTAATTSQTTKRKPAKKAPKTKTKKVVAKEQEVKEVPKKVIVEKSPLPTEEKLPDAITNSKLPVYIAKELLEKKKNLRKRYQDEVAALRDRGNIQFVIITIGSERYAIEIDNIKEIVPITEISKTPNTPSHIKGISNVRGNTYVVFDLADKFKVKGDEFPKYLLVLNNREINSSLTLSVLPSTLKVKGSNISSDLQTIEDALLDASYIKGLIQNEEQLIYYLDIIELIKNEKAIVVPDELLEQIDE